MWSCRCRMPATADCLHGGGRTCPTSPATCCWSAFPAPLEHGSRPQRIARAEARSPRGMQFSKVDRENTSELQSLMRIPYAVIYLEKKTHIRAQCTPMQNTDQ